jgi:hypothetical protein
MQDMDLPSKDGPYGMWVILAGLMTLTVVTLGAFFRFTRPDDIANALGPIIGVIGTLVGAYFGMRGASLAQQHANTAKVAISAAATAPAPAPNGTGDPAAVASLGDTAVADRVDELAQLDASDDATGADGVDPEEMALDSAPNDEGDDVAPKEAHS